MRRRRQSNNTHKYTFKLRDSEESGQPTRNSFVYLYNIHPMFITLSMRIPKYPHAINDTPQRCSVFYFVNIIDFRIITKTALTHAPPLHNSSTL
jgi:hypothetical protein